MVGQLHGYITQFYQVEICPGLKPQQPLYYLNVVFKNFDDHFG